MGSRERTRNGLRGVDERPLMTTAPTPIRAAREEDLSFIVELAMALGAQHIGYDPRRFDFRPFGADEEAVRATYLAFFREQLGQPNVVLFVAEDRAGYVFGRLEEASFLDLAPEAGWIHDVFVDPSARGQRLGARLVDAAIAGLRALGVSEVMLSASPKNARARALFEARGFVPTMVEYRLNET